MTNASSQLSQTIIEAKQQEVFNAIEVNRTKADLMATHQIELNHLKALSEAEIVPMDGVDGGPSEQYFAKLCAADKANKELFGNNATTISLNSAKEVETTLVKATQDVPLAKAAREIQNNHYTKYCSQSSVDENLCDVAAQIPNADILASIALKPSNEPDKAVLKHSAFKTEYTYSDFELEAANDYYDNILLVNHLPTPRLNGASVQHDVVARYKQLKAAQSLALHSFKNSIANRTALDSSDSSDKRMSQLDLLSFKLFKAQTDDITAAQIANENGANIILYNSRVTGDRLRLLQLSAKERIANLQAAYLALKLSSPEQIANINQKK